MESRLLRFVVGVCAGVAVTSAYLYFQLSAELFNSVLSMNFINWSVVNLKWSIIPFFITFIVYAFSLLRLRKIINEETDLEVITQTEQMVDISTHIFFGVGVVWTAIGMRSALITALGELDPIVAQELGAFQILKRLVDGGILLALSTTIFGAVGGYIMKMTKILTVGYKLNQFYIQHSDKRSEKIEDALSTVNRNLVILIQQRKRFYS